MSALIVSTQEGLTTKWARVAVEWLTHRRSTATQKTYRAGLKHFLAWLDGKPLWEVKRADIIAFRDHMAKVEEKKDATIGNYLAAVSSLYRFAIVEGLIERNPCETVERPPMQASRRPRWMTTEQQREVLASIDVSTLIGKRDKAIMTLALLTGMRASALVSAHIRDLDEAPDGSVALTTRVKGGNLDTRTLPAAAVKAIGAYLKARGEPSPDEGVFVSHSRRGKLLPAVPISTEALRDIVARYTEPVLGKPLTPHGCRHTAARQVYSKTKDIRKVQRFLGHKDISVTQKYIETLEDDRAEVGEMLAEMLEL